MLTSTVRTYIEDKARFYKTAAFDAHIGFQVEQFLKNFLKITRFYALFHACYFILGVAELIALAFFLPFFAKSSILALSIAGLFLSGFSYFVLRFYFETKKPEQFLQLKEDFIQTLYGWFSQEDSNEEKRALLCSALYQLTDKLEDIEYNYYKLPRYFKSLVPLMEKFSLWFHWRDAHEIKEILYQECVRENIQFVKASPTDLQAHAALAESYTRLYKIYMPKEDDTDGMRHSLLSSIYIEPDMVEKFQKIASRALEEYKILDIYSPEDPWVHLQMAYIYHDLGHSDKEMQVYEKLLHIAPQEREFLFSLGILYFQQGLNAQGLKIYEELKKDEPSKADDLIEIYGY